MLLETAFAGIPSTLKMFCGLRHFLPPCYWRPPMFLLRAAGALPLPPPPHPTPSPPPQSRGGELGISCEVRGVWRRSGTRYGQNGPPQADFGRFSSLAPDMARIDPRRLLLSILAAIAVLMRKRMGPFMLIPRGTRPSVLIRQGMRPFVLMPKGTVPFVLMSKGT